MVASALMAIGGLAVSMGSTVAFVSHLLLSASVAYNYRESGQARLLNQRHVGHTVCLADCLSSSGYAHRVPSFIQVLKKMTSDMHENVSYVSRTAMPTTPTLRILDALSPEQVRLRQAAKDSV